MIKMYKRMITMIFSLIIGMVIFGMLFACNSKSDPNLIEENKEPVHVETIDNNEPVSEPVPLGNQIQAEKLEFAEEIEFSNSMVIEMEWGYIIIDSNNEVNDFILLTDGLFSTSKLQYSFDVMKLYAHHYKTIEIEKVDIVFNDKVVAKIEYTRPPQPYQNWEDIAVSIEKSIMTYKDKEYKGYLLNINNKFEFFTYDGISTFPYFIKTDFLDENDKLDYYMKNFNDASSMKIINKKYMNDKSSVSETMREEAKSRLKFIEVNFDSYNTFSDIRNGINKYWSYDHGSYPQQIAIEIARLFEMASEESFKFHSLSKIKQDKYCSGNNFDPSLAGKYFFYNENFMDNEECIL